MGLERASRLCSGWIPSLKLASNIVLGERPTPININLDWEHDKSHNEFLDLDINEEKENTRDKESDSKSSKLHSTNFKLRYKVNWLYC